MRSLTVAALLLCSDATQEETSLMQGLVARHNKLGSAESAKDTRKDATAKLMETATKMMKNGVTPDVVTFIETTITEVNQNVLGQIVDEHNRDQQLINDLLARFQRAVEDMEECAASVAQQHEDRTQASITHKMCRSGEAIDCARSRKCEEELEELWEIVKIEEQEMRRIHDAIHGEWCIGPAPDHPGLADPFRWQITEHSEGAETSESVHAYPEVELEPVVIEFRRFSVEYFGHYIIQKPRVEEAWENYEAKLIECAALEETWTLKVDECDDAQEVVHDQACAHASSNRQCASTFGHEYHMTEVAYNEAVTAIQQLEFDRKREWETLKIVTCLLETVYTHVIHSIDTGEPCPTTESHPDQTEEEINFCHVVEESLTANLTIDYGTPPPPPPLPPVVEPPCTAQYLWDEHGSFTFEIQASHSETIATEGLGDYFTILSAYGWAGCAAPRACSPCESTDLIVDPAYVSNEVCKEHHGHLNPGQLDADTFKCLSGDECIRSAGRCNGAANCDDGSDELGCETDWGVPAMLQNEECQDPFVSDVQFRCGDGTCAHIAGKCNGINNCRDGSDELGCATTTTGVTLEATTGYTATIETPTVGAEVFTDRLYTFTSLGSFAGYKFVKMSNEDKHIRHSHVQMKLRLTQPETVYVAKLDDKELPWLIREGWSSTNLEGVTYRGIHETRHTEWDSSLLTETEYGPGEVWQKTFTAGTVEMRGNGGGDGSYVMFVANPANPPTPPVTIQPVLGEMQGRWVDQGGNFYGGATIVLGNQCGVEDPGQAVWQTASYRCDLSAGVWQFIETRAAGGEHTHAMTMQDDGTIRVTKGNSHVWILHRELPTLYHQVLTDTKCPHNHGDRLFRNPAGNGGSAITLEQCHSQCAATEGCTHFSFGTQGGNVCMGCTTDANAQSHAGFTLYALAAPEPPVCCQALTAECLACADQVSVSEYCGANPHTQGCAPANPWQLVVQYGDSPYTPTASGSGALSEAGRDFAKLSDQRINALPSGGEAGYDYYMLTSDSPSNGMDTIFARVVGAYNDLSPSYGFTSFETCAAASFDQCTSWARGTGTPGRNGLDTFTNQATNHCGRWFTGYNANIMCFVPRSSVQRCWSTGNTCSWGSHAIRKGVKMYKKVA